MFNRSYLQQVAMIESECQPRKKQPMLSTYTKSPLRDRQNRINLGNTPGRTGPKASLSPLRSRRSQLNAPNRAGLSRKRAEPQCINDPSKAAKFVAYSDGDTLYYCEKCAILLASQGFSVARINSTAESFQANPRKEEIEGFLNELEQVVGTLSKKQQGISNNIATALQTYQEEEAKVEEYYGHFYQIIDELKRRVLEELKEEYQNGIAKSAEAKEKFDNALNDSKRMKDDIIESMSIILHDSGEQQFRPIMNKYQNNLRDYRSLSNKFQTAPIVMRRLDFKDNEAACNALEQGLMLQWQEKEGEMECSKQSQCPQNPVQVIETEEKFTKSSLKEIGNLFSSFDE